MQNRDIKHCTAFVPYMALVLFDETLSFKPADTVGKPILKSYIAESVLTFVVYVHLGLAFVFPQLLLATEWILERYQRIVVGMCHIGWWRLWCYILLVAQIMHVGLGEFRAYDIRVDHRATYSTAKRNKRIYQNHEIGAKTCFVYILYFAVVEMCSGC